MTRRTLFSLLFGLIAFSLAALPALGQKKYDPGATDKEIKRVIKEAVGEIKGSQKFETESGKTVNHKCELDSTKALAAYEMSGNGAGATEDEEDTEAA